MAHRRWRSLGFARDQVDYLDHEDRGCPSTPLGMTNVEDVALRSRARRREEFTLSLFSQAERTSSALGTGSGARSSLLTLRV
jgi:hypothetical protein